MAAVAFHLLWGMKMLPSDAGGGGGIRCGHPRLAKVCEGDVGLGGTKEDVLLEVPRRQSQLFEATNQGALSHTMPDLYPFNDA
jgi:hypothetical protein